MAYLLGALWRRMGGMAPPHAEPADHHPRFFPPSKGKKLFRGLVPIWTSTTRPHPHRPPLFALPMTEKNGGTDFDLRLPPFPLFSPFSRNEIIVAPLSEMLNMPLGNTTGHQTYWRYKGATPSCNNPYRRMRTASMRAKCKLRRRVG